MKLLLTSSGFKNPSIIHALEELVGTSLHTKKLAFIPTAGNVTESDKSWLIRDLVNCKNLGVEEIDIVDISAIPQALWKPRLVHADILVFGGGNSFHLLYWIKKTGLAALLPELLKTRVYVGISAGSIVATKSLQLSSEKHRNLAKQIGEYDTEEGLGFTTFHVRPHLNSPKFPKTTIENLHKIAEEIKEPVYVIDDNSAIKVVDDSITVVTEGTWKKFN